MTMWFNRSAGQFVVSTSDAEQPEEDPRLQQHAMLVGADCPDWIRVPAEAPHPDAGRALRVANIINAPCPQCEDTMPARTYTFSDSELIVTECTNGHGFLWYTK